MNSVAFSGGPYRGTIKSEFPRRALGGISTFIEKVPEKIPIFEIWPEVVPMAHTTVDDTSKFVTSKTFWSIVGIAVIFAGGTFALLHNDINGVRSQLRQMTTTEHTDSLSLQKQLGELNSQVGTTNGKLDVLIQLISRKSKYRR